MTGGRWGAEANSYQLKVSLGHTNASTNILAQAVERGATGFTHLGNGCPRELDRHDNILWRVFEARGLRVGLIPDGFHVSPASRFSDAPAQWLGLPSGLTVGGPADFCVLTVTQENQLKNLKVFCNGEAAV